MELSKTAQKQKKKWFRLDNAALIFPAIMKSRWNNVFRVSVTLTEPVDPNVLSEAAAELHDCFPTFFVRLRKGLFWYYLEEIDRAVTVQEDYAYPLTHMNQKEIRKCCIRILYYQNRIAVEFFHSVTDGTGGLIFVKNLAAHYLRKKYGLAIPNEDEIREPEEQPTAEELSDGFLKASGPYAMSRKEAASYRLHGVVEPNHFQHITTGILDEQRLLETAHQNGGTVTAFLSAVMCESIREIQETEVPVSRQKAVQIAVPVNFRKLYGINTLRNFILPVNVGINPKFGTYTIPALTRLLANEIQAETTPNKMAARIAANVKPAKNPIIRLMPLGIKSFVMRMVYYATGEKYASINVSNLGRTEVPDAMKPYVDRFEFIVGVQAFYPNNSSVISYGGRTYVNMIRNTVSSELERRFFSKLVELGVPVEIESNRRN